jgi:hypothetical protein
MGLEITPSTQVWISHGDDWEQVPGVTDVRLEEDLPVEEHEELTRSFQGFVDRLLASAYAEAARRYRQALAESLAGIDTWEPRGLWAWLAEPEQPTPIERAMEILAPHLAREPLYQPNRWWPAVPPPSAGEQSSEPAESAPALARPAWQSPYGPAPRRW